MVGRASWFAVATTFIESSAPKCRAGAVALHLGCGRELGESRGRKDSWKVECSENSQLHRQVALEE